ncbi:hypothetical protein K458DRAFT_415323 [Lentithecium fluviatile CBS 122367]|uniref:BZIP domain-containing protein n=1 Tax=Lentithecium fluviatile CBS 122367 TaxID=1168545 RepID=A0A6G1JA56_9PLEO|nr:hypothetical protein K458DRAFT_415323 [Lentithecium fluviatile CBS 122367]
MNSQYGMTPPPADLPPTTIKMEDLQVPFESQSHPSIDSRSSSTPSVSGSVSGSVNGDGKTVKKRKSWGQVLPEPKTNLPPRKRAKTEDEKEQRRIERVKRNRLAAHNSRERKRQEYEHIQIEKDKLEADLDAARRAIAQMGAELKAYREKYPGGVDFVFDTASDLDSFLSSTDTINPAATTSSSFPSPVSMTMDSIDSPRDSSCQPETPDYSEVAPDFDTTRYPAEILCDLQCQSTSAAPASLAAIWAFLSLFNLSLQLPWTTSLSTIFSTSTSSQTRPPPMALWNPLLAWWTATSSSLPASSPTTMAALAFLTTLMQSASTCRQPLAQLTLATGLSQRATSIGQVAWALKASRRANDGGMKQRRFRSLRSRQMGWRRKGSLTLRREITRALGRSLDAVSSRQIQSGHCV